MICASCGAENRPGSNYCRYCATPLTQQKKDPDSGYIPSVPPPATEALAYQAPTSYQVPPQALAPVKHKGLVCPRCGSTNVLKGTTPVWAVVAAVAGFLLVLCFSLLFLLVKDPHKCLNCGLEFKS